MIRNEASVAYREPSNC